VIVHVKDDGIGIPPEMMPDVFNLFAQVDRTLQRSQGGLGIGLNIVKRLVELHGGSVEGFSKGRGEGTEFVVRLPLVQEASAGGQVTATDEGGVVPARLLVVDDNEDVARSLVMVLQRMGCDVRSALNATDALREGRDFRPELVLMDIGMPIVDGYELCRQARAEEWGRAAMIVAVTGWGQEEDKRRAYEAGFDHHIVKPISKAELGTLLHNVRQRRPVHTST
jgi:CheY-like chemotaxis protein